MKFALSLVNIATEIRTEHAHAVRHAETAVRHAVRAGELLLSAKDRIGHGDWLPWLAENCGVSSRQAQRYMRAAQGKPMPVRAIANATPVSHSQPEGTGSIQLFSEGLAETLAYGFVPSAGLEAQTILDGGDLLLVQPSIHDHFHFAPRILSPSLLVRGISRPIRIDMIGALLRRLDVKPEDVLHWMHYKTKPFAASPWLRPGDESECPSLVVLGIAI